MAYPEQVTAKAEMLEELFAPFWPEPVAVTPSPVLWHYRNKVDPSFAPKRYDEPPPKDFVRESVLGFKKKGRWFWPLEIDECRIGPERLGALMKAVRKWSEDAGLRAFDSRSGAGMLRALLVREGKHTGEYMVVLITRPGDLDCSGFVEAVRSVLPTASIQRGIFSGLADVAMAEELEVLSGPPEITEELHLQTESGERRLRFRISPMSFFQTNTIATEGLYGHIRQWLQQEESSALYDLYGGAGGIAFSCADLVEHVWSVENVEAASEDGRHNAQVNEIDNVTFITEKVKNYLLYRSRDEGLVENAAVVVDPPRAGMHPKALKRLIELAPTRILYVSCNPKILARELPVLLESYQLRQLHAFDLFPHTRHVEVVAELSRKA